MYTPATNNDIQKMLEEIGVSSLEDLFADIPKSLRLQKQLNLPTGMNELSLVKHLTALAKKNVSTQDELSFVGYGMYDHFIPAVCNAITSRSEFQTAYTPYQPEISQGTLQAIFEFQTGISELCSLPVANASLYDGATAAAESMYLSQQVTRRNEAVICKSVSKLVKDVVATYARAYGMKLIEVDFTQDGTTDLEALKKAVNSDTACVIFQQPNAFGLYEDAPTLCEIANDIGAVPVASVDPLSLGVLEGPGNYNAGIAIGEGQALGNSLSFGGPSFGFMACDTKFMRRMPGRIVGESQDSEGQKAYVLTLQTREQHIRREKATSNICTNQALNALSGIVYLSWLGPKGLEDIGHLLIDRNRILREKMLAVPGITLAFEGPTFKEQVFLLPIPAEKVIAKCKEAGINPGYPIGKDYPILGDRALLICATEKRSVEEIETLVETLKEVIK